jgi:hypothetical protein
MPVEFHILLQGEQMPEIAEWQQAIDDASFDLQLDPSDEAYLGGAVSVRLLQQGTTFEFWMGEVKEMVEAYPEAADHASESEADAVATFVVGSELEELYAALIAASTLAKFSDGIFFDPQEGIFLDGDDAIEYARSAMSEDDEDDIDEDEDDEDEDDEDEDDEDGFEEVDEDELEAEEPAAAPAPPAKKNKR